jgi:hypothetical protein
MAAKKDNKTTKNNQVEEVSLDDLDLDVLKKAVKANKDIIKEDLEDDDILDDELEELEEDLLGEKEPTPEELEEIRKLKLDNDDLAIVEDDDEDDDIAIALKKEKGLSKLPKDRSEDKRRVGKGITEFIDVKVPEKILE